MPQGFSFEEATAEPQKPKPFSFLEAQTPEMEFPAMGPESTLADTLKAPVPNLTPDRGGVVRSVLPGVLQPEDLQPAIRLIGGKVVTPKEVEEEGNKFAEGPTHPDIIRQHGLDAEDIDQRGFVGPNGEFLDREAAAKATQLPTQREEGRLHSTDLFETAPRNRPQALPPPDLAAQDPRLDLSKQVASGFALPDQQQESLIPIPPKAFEAAKGTPAEPIMNWSFGPPEPYTKDKPQSPLERALLYASVELPLGPMGKKASGAVTDFARSIYNASKGVPEFLNTEEGALTLLASMVPEGKLAFEGLFTIDMAKSAWAQKNEFVRDWKTSTLNEKAIALGKGFVTAYLGYKLAGATVKTGVGLASRYGLGTPTPVTAAPKAVQDARLKSVLEQGKADLGKNWDYVPGELEGHEGQVAHTRPDGTVVVSEQNLHDRLQRDVAAGVKIEDAIKNVVSEESNHGALVTMPGGRELAAKHWNNFSDVEKFAFRRILQGKQTETTPRLDDWQYGAEAMRFAMQRLENTKPGEHIFGTQGQIFESKLLTSLMDVIGWIRKKLGTSARKEQLAHLDTLQSRINELRKGAKDASGQQEAAKVHGAVPAQPVEGAGQVPAKEGVGGIQPQAEGRVAEAAQVPLRPNPNLPGWLNEAMIREGKDPNRPLNEIDITNPSIREAVINDPTLTAEQKAQILKTGSEKAPPVAPTKGAPKRQAPKGKATKPPAATPAGEPAATAPISPTAVGVKEQELAAIKARTTELQRLPFSPRNVREMQALAEKQHALEKSMGQTPGQKAGGGIGDVLAMTQKPREIADDLGLEYRGTTSGRDQYVFKQTDEFGMSSVTVTVPEGSQYDVVKAKLQERVNQSVAMTRKPEVAKQETGDRLNAFGDPLGTTYHATPEDWAAWQKIEADRAEAMKRKDFDAIYQIGKQAEPLKNKYGGMPPAPPKPETLSMSRKLSSDYEDLKKRYPAVEWNDPNKSPKGNYWITPDGKMGRVDNHPQAAERITKRTVEEMAEFGDSDPYDEMFRNGWVRGAWNRWKDTLMVETGGRPIGYKARQALRDWGIENNASVLIDDHSSVRDGTYIYDAKAGEETLAMSQKPGEPMDEKQVALRIASALHKAVLDPEARKATFNEVADLILKQPRENWAPMLTEFEAQFAGKEISETEKQLAKTAELAAAGQIPGVAPGARIVDPNALQAKIREVFGGLDREGLDRGLIYEFNQEPEVVQGGKKRKVKSKLGGRKGTEEVESTIAEPQYKWRGKWELVEKKMKERDPSLPDSVLRDRYVNRMHQFLAYAPAETLRRLIIAEGAADRFLGREIVTEEGGQKVVRYTRIIPEPNLEPAVRDMDKAPSPDNPTEFEKFVQAKGISVERGKQLLEEYRQAWGRQKAEAEAAEKALEQKYAPKPGATREEAEALLKEWKAKKAEINRLKEELKKGERYNRERRDNAVNFLAEKFIQDSLPPEVMPNRGEVDIGQIWYDHPDGHRGYTEFTPEQGGDSLLLRKYLGRGAQVPGKTVSKLTRGITTVVHEGTKEVSSLSTYRHPTNGQVMIYDPRRPPGAEGKALPGDKYMRLNKLLGLGYRVKSYMLVFDPVTDFHQKWAAEGERTAEQVFDSRLGTDAEAQGRGRVVALDTLVNQQIPTEGGEFDDPGEVTPESMYAFNSWLRSKGGQTWGFFGTDPQALIRGPITSVEADAVYRAFKENQVKSVDDWERVFNRMRVDRRIAESKPLAAMFQLSPWEYCFTSAIEKIARKRYRELTTGTGHYGPDKNGFPNPEATQFREKIEKYPPLPKDFIKEYTRLKGEAADKMFNTLTEDQKNRYRLVEYHRQNELLNALEYAYETAKDIQSKSVGKGGAGLVEGPITAAPDTIAFRQRAIAEYGDTARQEVEQDAVRKTVSRQYAGRPVPRQLGPTPEPGTPVSARGLTRQVPTYEEMGTTKIPGPGRGEVLARAEQQFPTPKGLPPSMPFERPPAGAAEPAVPPEQFPGRLMRRAATMPAEVEISGGRGGPVSYLARPFRPIGAPRGRNLLREPGTEQLLMRKVIEQSREPEPRPDPFREVGGGETLAMTRKHGVANVYQRDMVAEGRASIDFADPDEGPLVHINDLIQAGREAVINGEIQPRATMVMAKESFKEGGAPWLTWKHVAAMRYHDYQLQQMADVLDAEKSPQYAEARQLSDEWHKDFNEIAKAATAHQMHVLQGYSIIGPADMQSITFVRREYAKARGEAEGYDPNEEYDLTPQEEEWVKKKVAEIKGEGEKVEGGASDLDKASQKLIEPTTDEGNKIAIEKAKREISDIMKRAREGLGSRGTGGIGDVLAMARKVEKELPKLSEKDSTELVDLGAAVMMELSDKGKMSDVLWRQEMVRELGALKTPRPDLEPYLDHVRATAEQRRNELVNNIIGTGDPFISARDHFTRKQPTIEESKAAINRAFAIDKTGQRITPMEAYHIWNYLRLRFFNAAKPEWDIRTIREKAGQELGVGANRLFRAMASNRSMREPTDALLKKMRDEQRVRSQATNWLKNLEYPGWFRALRVFPRLFFFDKILGHGLVPLITHASNMLFNPYSWGVYFKAWPEMYRMSFGTKPISRLASKLGGPKWEGMTGKDYHELRMQELMGHDRFEWWKRRGLEHDPFKFSDDYLLEHVYNLFEEKGIGGRALAKIGIPGREFLQAMVGGRSFDVLKQLRLARAEQWLQSLPEHLRNKEMGDLIADSVNHATGIVRKNFGEAGNWLLFAPKLEGSRWAWLFRDTIKAADIWRRSDATIEQKTWAKKELKQKAAVLGMYWGMLAMNQGFLTYVLGSDQKVNAFDPTKSDFMQFKMAGFRVGVLSPIIGIFRLFATLAHDTFGERTKYERLTTRPRAMFQHSLEYARGKASPIASFGLETATAQTTYPTRPLEFLPWSEPLTRAQRLRGVEPMGLGEFSATSFSPIPLEEVLRETWEDQGVDEGTIEKWIRSLIIGGTMAGTGARVARDVQR